MRGRFLVVLAGFLAISGASARTAAAQGGAPTPSGGATSRSFIARHCTACHNTRMKTAGLALAAWKRWAVGGQAAGCEQVVAKLRGGSMPPVGRPQPDARARAALAAWLESELARAAARAPNPVRPTAFHRLNRTEYQNAVRDILSL